MARRLAGALLTLVGVSLLVFLVLRVIPGNQITASLGTESGVLTPEQLASLKSYYGLNQPLPLQYLDWLGNVFTGNLGVSLRSGQSVSAMTAASLPVTLELAFFSQLPEGSLLVYVNDRKVLQQDFRFYEKSSFFRSHPSTGWVRQSFRVPAGDAAIRLYVTPHGSAAVVRTFKGNFPGGASRRLDAKLTGDGDVTAQLN